jgi:hypothetical protein
VGEYIIGQVIWQGDGHSTIPTPCGNGTTELHQDGAGHLRVSEARRINIQPYCEHATANITVDCLRVDQISSGDGNTNAHIGCQMHVGHYGYLLDVRCAPETINRLRHVAIHWCSEPGSNWGDE